MRRSDHVAPDGERVVAIDVRPHDVLPRVEEGQVWAFGRRLEVIVSQVVPGANGGGEDLVYFGPLARGRERFSVRCGVHQFLKLATKAGGRIVRREKGFGDG